MSATDHPGLGRRQDARLSTVSPPPYRDTSLTTEQRVQDVLGRMSRDEKPAQLGSAYVYELLDGPRLDPERADVILRHGIGHISRIGGASALPPLEVAALANAHPGLPGGLDTARTPAMVHEECLAGYMATGATRFPKASGWPQPGIRRLPRKLRRWSPGRTARGCPPGLAPVLDICRDSRWGRVEETVGEDPYLVGAMGVRTVRGLQSGDAHRGWWPPPSISPVTGYPKVA